MQLQTPTAHETPPQHRPRDQLRLLGPHPRRPRGDPLAGEHDRPAAADPHGARLRPRGGGGARLLGGDGRALRPQPRGHRRQPRRHPARRAAGGDLEPPLRHPRRADARPHPRAHPRRLPHPRPPRLPQGGRARPGDPADQLRRDPRGAGRQRRDPAARARLPRERRLHRHLPRRHRLDRAPAVRPADGPVLAPLHRPADREVRRRGGPGLLRGPQQPALPAREPPAHHAAHGAAGQRVQDPRRRPGAGGGRPRRSTRPGSPRAQATRGR